MPRKRKDLTIAPAVTALEEDVIFGRLRPLERLTEEDVMNRFRLTRHLSRQVLQRLRALGIVAGDRAGGTIVRAFSLEEIEQIYEVRELLQEQALRRMPLPVPRAVIARLREIHRRYCAAVRAGDLSTVFRANDELHDAIFDACGNAVLADAIKKYTWLTHGVRSRVFADPTHLKRATDDHGRLIDALEGGDRTALIEVNRRHVNHPKHAYVSAQQWQQTPAAAPAASRKRAPKKK
ncbi:MAG: GntR family transcriptional regulator [Burkholderiales bacterium]